MVIQAADPPSCRTIGQQRFIVNAGKYRGFEGRFIFDTAILNACEFQNRDTRQAAKITL
jgi:hypothetical protein